MELVRNYRKVSTVGSFIVFILCIGGPIAGFIWWEIHQRRTVGNWQQQAYRKNVKRTQEQILLGQVDGHLMRDAMKLHKQKGY